LIQWISLQLDSDSQRGVEFYGTALLSLDSGHRFHAQAFAATWAGSGLFAEAAATRGRGRGAAHRAPSMFAPRASPISTDIAPMSSAQLIDCARRLADGLEGLQFGSPVAHVYNPLRYAREPHELYLRRFGNGPKQIVFLGMNPGPFGMMQTGVPFGEVAAVRKWMRIEAPVLQPIDQHPKRPIEGFACPRSEVSGRRLWGWAEARFGSAEQFFEHAFVVNYCPLVWLESSGRNRTPEQLPVAELDPVIEACNVHLARTIEILRPRWLIGVGGFAEKRLRAIVESSLLDSTLARQLKIVQILHPSPASPAANRGWAEAVDRQLAQAGVLPLNHD
jgi:single-strand selective monofunctional uracil DNA glycosylase